MKYYVERQVISNNGLGWSGECEADEVGVYKTLEEAKRKFDFEVDFHNGYVGDYNLNPWEGLSITLSSYDEEEDTEFLEEVCFDSKGNILFSRK